MSGINLVVAPTDRRWFETLRWKQNLGEVNCWSPSALGFHALKVGELFLFKLHAPHNVIVGGGIFAHSNVMPCSLAWDAFGEANGAKSLQDLRQRICSCIPRDRRPDPDGPIDFSIGCRILNQPFFFEEADWIPQPANWPPNTVRYKRYNTGEDEGLDLWNAVIDCLNRMPVADMAEDHARFGAPQLIMPRRGQGTFRMIVTDTYRRRCAVTSERTLPALDAAHIRPYSATENHDVQNGLLLRGDIHKLFDKGYVTVTPKFHFEVSTRIREEFENGQHYYDMHGRRIRVPRRRAQRPDPEALAWHNENCFLG